MWGGPPGPQPGPLARNPAPWPGLAGPETPAAIIRSRSSAMLRATARVEGDPRGLRSPPHIECQGAAAGWGLAVICLLI